jgi:ribosome-associated heat shock protein Hsp15
MIFTEGKMRVDKWLWCVRIFKSRSLASEACRDNKVTLEDRPVKPSQLIQTGNHVHVKKGGYNLQFEVKGLLKSRAAAPVAQQCYVNHTPEEELRKFESWYVGKGKLEFREKGLGRPTKKDRRNIDAFKGFDR